MSRSDGLGSPAFRRAERRGENFVGREGFFRRRTAELFAEHAFPLIGVGGVDSGATTIAKIKAGASLVQLYSGLVYRGIGLVAQIKADLLTALKRGHRDSLASMVGSDAADITAESWPG